MKPCSCGRAPRNLGYYNPRTRGPLRYACSMKCQDALCAVEGHVELLKTEGDAVKRFVGQYEADFRSFNFASASVGDLEAFAGWVYIEMCQAVQAEYADGPIEEHELPF